MKKLAAYVFICIFMVVTVTACSKSGENSSETIKAKENSSETIKAKENSSETIKAKENSSETMKAKEKSLETIKAGENMKITSSSLNNAGKWLSAITLSKGSNKSPQLAWTPVENASCYAIYMIDTSAGNWCHWMAKDVKVTEVEFGGILNDSQYIGPYPPSGEHTYEVMVFALKASPDSYAGYFDNENASMDKILKALDTSKGATGNVLSKGVLAGTYKTGDVVE